MVECTERVSSNGLLDLENNPRFTMDNINMDSKVATESLPLAQEIFTKGSGNKVKDTEKELWSIRLEFRFKRDSGIKVSILGSLGKKKESHKLAVPPSRKLMNQQ
jgi:hypothetical protein